MTSGADELSGQDEPVHVRISLGHTGDQALYVRVTPTAAPEIKSLLESEGVYAGDVLEFSTAPDLAIIAASFGAGLTGLAAALNAFFHRNRYKQVKFSNEAGDVEIAGLDEEEVAAVVSQVLKQMHDKQLEVDREWQRTLREERGQID